jgi:hypothetical protein
MAPIPKATEVRDAILFSTAQSVRVISLTGESMGKKEKQTVIAFLTVTVGPKDITSRRYS